jgi:stress response protein SCP2
MEKKEEYIVLEEVLKSLNDNFDVEQRAKILQQLKESNPTDDALLGAKLLLEENNWDFKAVNQLFEDLDKKLMF